MLNFDLNAYGGPLFLKLLLDQVTTTSEANLKQPILIIDIYRIKISCPGEEISKVVDVFTAIYENIVSLSNGELHIDSVKNLLKVLQTTSVSSPSMIFSIPCPNN